MSFFSLDCKFFEIVPYVYIRWSSWNGWTLILNLELSVDYSIITASFSGNMKAYLFLDANALGEKESTSSLLANIYRGFTDCQLSSARGWVVGWARDARKELRVSGEAGRPWELGKWSVLRNPIFITVLVTELIQVFCFCHRAIWFPELILNGSALGWSQQKVHERHFLFRIWQ